MEQKRELVKAREDVNRKIKSLQADVSAADQWTPPTEISKRDTATQYTVDEAIQAVPETASVKSQKFIFRKEKDTQAELPQLQDESMQTEQAPTDTVYGYDPSSDMDDEDISDERRYEKEHEKNVTQEWANTSEEVFKSDYLDQYKGPERPYIAGLAKDAKLKDYDPTYGVRWTPSEEKFTIGNSPINFTPTGFIINGVAYEGNPQIYELMFKRKPKGTSTAASLQTYHDELSRLN